MLLRLPGVVLLITGCAQQTFTVQNKPVAVALKETITHHFSVSELGRRKLSMQPKFVAAQKMLLKQKTQQTFVNGLLGFITFRHFLRTAGSACSNVNNRRVAHRYGQLYLHCSLIYFWVPSSCF